MAQIHPLIPLDSWAHIPPLNSAICVTHYMRNTLIYSRIFVPSNPYLIIQYCTIKEREIQICSACIPGQCAAVSRARSFSNSIGDKSLTFWSSWVEKGEERERERKLHDQPMQCCAGQVEQPMQSMSSITSCSKVLLTIKNIICVLITAFGNGGWCYKYGAAFGGVHLSLGKWWIHSTADFVTLEISCCSSHLSLITRFFCCPI